MARKARTDAPTKPSFAALRTSKAAAKSANLARSRLLSIGSVVLFIAMFSLISFGVIRQQSPTVDEPVHLLSGYAALKWSDYRANPEHPPWLNSGAALPLLTMDIKDPRPTAIAWEIIPRTPPHTTHTGSVAAKLLSSTTTLKRFSSGPSCKWSSLRFCSVVLSIVGVMNCSASKPQSHHYSYTAWIQISLPIARSFIPISPSRHYFSSAAIFFAGHWKGLHGLDLRLPRAFSADSDHKLRLSCYDRCLGCTGLRPNVFASTPGMQFGYASLDRWPGSESCCVRLVVCSLIAAYGSIWAMVRISLRCAPGNGAPLPIATNCRCCRNWAVGMIVHAVSSFCRACIYGQLFVLNNLQREAYLLGAYSDHGFWLYFQSRSQSKCHRQR